MKWIQEALVKIINIADKHSISHIYIYPCLSHERKYIQKNVKTEIVDPYHFKNLQTKNMLVCCTKEAPLQSHIYKSDLIIDLRQDNIKIEKDSFDMAGGCGKIFYKLSEIDEIENFLEEPSNTYLEKEYPHLCPHCNGPSYNDIFFGKVDCKNKCY